MPYNKKKLSKEENCDLKVSDLIKLQQVAKETVPSLRYDYNFARRKLPR